MTKRLFQGLMLTAVLGLALPATAQASTISFNSDTFTGQAKFGTFPDTYVFRLTFDQVDSDFDVNVTAAIFTNQNTIPPGYVCVPIAGGTDCILFTVTTTASEGNGWTGNFRVDIIWAFNTDPLYPNTPVNQNGLGLIRILHFGTEGTDDITLANTYCTSGPNCSVGDPGIGGQANNFSGFMVTQAEAVPEPTSLLLLGSGVVGLVGLKRRQRRRALTRS